VPVATPQIPGQPRTDAAAPVLNLKDRRDGCICEIAHRWRLRTANLVDVQVDRADESFAVAFIRDPRYKNYDEFLDPEFGQQKNGV
jgi:acetone carboxylase gamma subunit